MKVNVALDSELILHQSSFHFVVCNELMTSTSTTLNTYTHAHMYASCTSEAMCVLQVYTCLMVSYS